MDFKDQLQPESKDRREKPRLTPEQREDFHDKALDILYRQQYRDITEGKLSEDEFVKISKAERKRLDDLAGIDAMTGLLNRRMCEEQAEGLVATEHEHGHEVAIFELDIDHFKMINDENGHPAGDEVLRAIGGALQKFIGENKENVVGRWGGEEFLLAFPHLEGKELVGRMKEVRNEAVLAMSGILGRPVTVSIGAIEVSDGEKFTAAIRRADEALYKAKRSDKDRKLGRNRGMVMGKNQEVENAVEVAFE